MALFAALLEDPAPFASGAVSYSDSYPGEEKSRRIVVLVTVAGQTSTPAVVDTGSPWCILDPEIAEQLGAFERTEWLRGHLIRGETWDGWLGRVEITLNADHGESIIVEATAFVPDLDAGEEWSNPNFVGLGLLERIRFAIDPSENMFYFGLTAS